MTMKKDFLCLAIDTASDTTSVSVLSSDGLTATEQMTSPRGQGEALMGMIQRVLTKIKKKPKDLTTIAVAIGPGSFTGVRIGLATARGLGLALNIPVVGVNNFVATSHLTSKEVFVVLDSKRSDYFVQKFTAKGKAIEAPQILSAQQLKKQLPFTAIGSGSEQLKEEINCKTLTLSQPLSVAIADIALHHQEKTESPHPLYLREADVTI